MNNAKSVTYNVSDKYVLDLGYQHDIDAYVFNLSKWEMYDTKNTLILNAEFKGVRKYFLLTVIDSKTFKWEGVGTYLTQYHGVLNCQLIEIETDNMTPQQVFQKFSANQSFVVKGRHMSLVFRARLSGSLPLDGTWESITTSMSSQAVLLNQLTTTVQTKLDNGDFDGADGYSPEVSTYAVTGGTQVVITSKDGAKTFIVKDGKDGVVSESDKEQIAEEVKSEIDLTSYAKKTDIPYSKTELDTKFNGQNTQIVNLETNKVDKVNGKGLSTNDYSNEDKQKVTNAITEEYIECAIVQYSGNEISLCYHGSTTILSEWGTYEVGNSTKILLDLINNNNCCLLIRNNNLYFGTLCSLNNYGVDGVTITFSNGKYKWELDCINGLITMKEVTIEQSKECCQIVVNGNIVKLVVHGEDTPLDEDNVFTELGNMISYNCTIVLCDEDVKSLGLLNKIYLEDYYYYLLFSNDEYEWRLNLSNAQVERTDKPSIPTKTSQLQNDSGFLTSHQDLSSYAKKTELFSGSYNDLEDKPTIPEPIDVQVGGTSIVEDGVAKIPLANGSQLGLVRAYDSWRGFGICVNPNNQLYVVKANDSEIKAKASGYNPITPSSLDFAIKYGLRANTQITDEDKPLICETIGAEQKKGEWTLVGTLTDCSQLSVDLSGYTELAIKSYISTASKSNNLQLKCNGSWGVLVYDIAYNSGDRYVTARWEDSPFGFDFISGIQQLGKTQSSGVTRPQAYNRVDGFHISDITDIKLAQFESDEIEVKIYAR